MDASHHPGAEADVELAAGLRELQVRDEPLVKPTYGNGLAAVAKEAEASQEASLAYRPAAELQQEISDLSGALNDLQSTLYEVQEKRHASGEAGGVEVDGLLPGFDASLEGFSVKISQLSLDVTVCLTAIEAAPFGNGGAHDATKPTTSIPASSSGGRTARDLRRSLKELINDWAEVVEREKLLKEELKEDKLTGKLREANVKAEEMMESLKKAIAQCSALSFQLVTPSGSDRVTDFEAARATLESYDQKKKFYSPGIAKTLAILEKSIKDRTTHNGDLLRLYKDLSGRWRNLHDEMTLMDKQFPSIYDQLEHLERHPELRNSLDVEGLTGSRGMPRRLAPPPNGLGIAPGQTRPRNTLTSTNTSSSSLREEMGRRSLSSTVNRERSRSRGEQGHLTASSTQHHLYSTPVSPSSTDHQLSVGPSSPIMAEASSYFANLRQGFERRQAGGAETPTKPKWNNSPRIVRPPSPDRAQSQHARYPDLPRRKSGALGMISGSASNSRPTSPTSSITTASSFTGQSGQRRLATPERKSLGGRALTGPPGEPSTARPHSPTFSLTCSTSTPNRRRSMLPVPRASLGVSPDKPARNRSASQLGFNAPPVPPMPNMKTISAAEARQAYLRSTMQTPEPVLRQRAGQMPFYQGRAGPGGGAGVGGTAGGSTRMTPSRMSAERPSMGPPATPTGQRSLSASLLSASTGRRTPGRTSQGPPSAFRDPDRPSSRTSMGRSGAATPSQLVSPSTFIPNKLDDLDMELHAILQSVPNDITVERIDPPIRKGQLHTGEWKAQYAFVSGRTGRKVLPCRLLELFKPGAGPDGQNKKVMVRMNGVWVDLRLHIWDLV